VVRITDNGYMGLRHDQGIVLRSFPFGEADRVVVLLSPNHGKLRAVAKGVRRTKSRFGGRLEPFTHVDLVLYEGRNLDTITQADVIEAFPRLRADLDRVLAAGAMVEVVDTVSQEREGSLRTFLLLQRGLRALEEGPRHQDLLAAFLLKCAQVVGVAPALEECAGCGAATGLARFSFAAGGALCERCRTSGAVVLREGLTSYLARLAASDLGVLPPPDAALSAEAIGVTRRFIEYHFDRRLESLAALDA
ncbi:MAG: DNA repair protein RecO, partial [Acidimicrobiia bacterium]